MTRARWAAALTAALALGGAVRGQTQEQSGPMLARAGSVTIKVMDYGTAERQVRAAASQQGAVLLDAKTSVNEKGRRHGWMRFQVAQARLAALLPALQTAGTLSAETLGATDNRSEYEELARRVARLQQHEQRLGGILQSDRRMRGSDVLFLQERLFRASVDESLLTQQRVDLARAARDSTLMVALFEPGSLPAPPPGAVDLAARFAGAAAQARGLWNAQAARAATAAAYVTVFAPLWLPALLTAIGALALLCHHRRQLIEGVRTLFTRLLTTLGVAIGWVRARRDARYDPIRQPRPHADDGTPWRS